MNPATNPYELYRSFLDKSTSLNRVLYPIRDRWKELGIPADYEDADRFNHLIMFLSQIMSFEAFVARCLRDECGLTPSQIRSLGSMETKIRVLLPGLDRDRRLAAAVAEVSWAFELRHTWMHGCGDPTLIVGATRMPRGRKRKAVPSDIFDDKPWNRLKWVDGHVWSKAATSLPQIAGKIAERFGWRTDA